MAKPSASAGEVVASLRLLSLSLERWRGAFARRWNLAENDSVVMSHLVSAGGVLVPRDIARVMNVTTGSMTAMLDRLEARKFVRREPNPDDRRSVRVVLTATGRGALRDTQEHLARRIDGGFDREMQRRLAHCLEDIAQLIDATTTAVADSDRTGS